MGEGEKRGSGEHGGGEFELDFDSRFVGTEATE